VEKQIISYDLLSFESFYSFSKTMYGQVGFFAANVENRVPFHITDAKYKKITIMSSLKSQNETIAEIQLQTVAVFF